MSHQLLLFTSEHFWSLNVDRREEFAQAWRHSNQKWVVQLFHHGSYFLLATTTWCSNCCSLCRLLNHGVPRAWDEAHRHYREFEVGLREATSNRQCWSARGASVSKGWVGVTRHMRDSLRDLQSYRRPTRALTIPEVVPKSKIVEATVGRQQSVLLWEKDKQWRHLSSTAVR
jgi:hypothetical protein